MKKFTEELYKKYNQNSLYKNRGKYVLKCLYNFGKQLGLAFQVVDDVLDFTSDDKQLGKPAANDLASGYLTAPALYAIEENNSLSESVSYPHLTLPPKA